MAVVNDDVFRIESLTNTGEVIKTDLSVNGDSSIFKGHFPGQHVVPGACMLQIVKEVLEEALGYAIQLKKGDNLKFVGMVVPSADNAVVLEISYKIIDDGIGVNAKLSDGDRVCFKFQGSFIRPQ